MIHRQTDGRHPYDNPMPSMISINSIAKKNPDLFPLQASAPCRIDSGGTWDIKVMALLFESIFPSTVNIALNLRTRAVISPYKEKRVKITSHGFDHEEEGFFDRLPFDSTFGIFFAAVNHFGFHGLKIDIHSDSPVKSALGGSSTALVSLIKALSMLKSCLGNKPMSRRDILHLGYHIEDGVAGGNCGVQDQAAAVYGGVSQWCWHYGNRSSMFSRVSLLDKKGMKEISSRVLVAFCGKSHVSASINRTWIKDFLSGKTRAGWIKANDVVVSLGKAIGEKAWNRATDLLRKEMEIRRQITPNALIPVTEKLIDQAEQIGCGARFAGAGAGGSVWALGEPEHIDRVRNIWEETLSSVKGAKVLKTFIDPDGVK